MTMMLTAIDGQRPERKALRVEWVMLANVLLTSVFAAVVHAYPAIGVAFCDFYYPIALYQDTPNLHVSFRMAVYVFSVLTTPVFIAAILWRGLVFAKVRGPSSLLKSARWKAALLLLVVGPVLWLGYPLYALGQDALAAHPVTYVLITALAFSATHLLVGVVRR